MITAIIHNPLLIHNSQFIIMITDVNWDLSLQLTCQLPIKNY